MANSCYNLYSFFGNAAVLEKVKEWQKQLSAYKPTSDDPSCMGAIRAVFYPDAGPDDYIDYGSKWVHKDSQSLDSTEDQIGLQSAWGSPDELQKQMTIILASIDGKVIIENCFNIEDGTEGYVYTGKIKDDDEVLLMRCAEQCDYSSFDEPSDAEEEMQLELEENRLETIKEFLNCFPERFDIFMSNMPEIAIKLYTSNVLSFYASESVINVVKDWRSRLEHIERIPDNLFNEELVEGVLFSKDDINAAEPYELDIDIQVSPWHFFKGVNLADNQLGLWSLGLPVETTQSAITSFLAKLDDNILVENHYTSADAGFEGFRYTMISEGQELADECFERLQANAITDDLNDQKEQMHQRIETNRKEVVARLIETVSKDKAILKDRLDIALRSL